MFESKGLRDIFPRAQPCSPVVIESMIQYMPLLNVELHLLRTLVKGMQILLNYPILLNMYGGNIDVSFFLSSKGTIVCNSSSSVFYGRPNGAKFKNSNLVTFKDNDHIQRPHSHSRHKI